MPLYLSQEWHDAAKALAEDFPERPGASARMNYAVSGGPTGDIAYYQIVENGRVVEQKIGSLPDADCTMSIGFADSLKIQKGELDANAAFMQGKVKVTGNMGKVMALMPLTMSAEYKDIQVKLRELTEY